ncbi:probable methyltransferase-like protein 15 [Pecten maximus]|uniref:probable methyltransferase-like protein 15 n=1 Tax=Pecten maximus TaxID=6579 RepID=UPI00145818F9|nr:probable methyltransferase-like protein 15 [Pecten maximus]XP_033752104.1 probable methyltransferase-like protein 15 [Pecten maximus]
MSSTRTALLMGKMGFGSYCQRRLLHQITKRSRVIMERKQNLLRVVGLHVEAPSDTSVGSIDCDRIKSFQQHVPVMAEMVMEHLQPKNEQLYIDMTFGGGGHTRNILSHAPKARVICVDRDPTAISIAQELAKSFSPGQILTCHSKFSLIHTLLPELGVTPGTVNGVLFDVGASSMQFDEGKRGFALSVDGPLDMRMDQSSNNKEPTAADIVNSFDEQELGFIIKRYSGEKSAMKIAHAIVEARSAFGRISRTQQLADIIASAFPEILHYGRKDKLKRSSHVATQTFMALRIFVNNELNELNNGLEVANHYLRPGGRCVTLTFHSLEDRIVKRHFHDIDLDTKPNLSLRQMRYNQVSTAEMKQILNKKWEPMSKRIVVPSPSECESNPRARSAKLRAAVKS